MLQALLRSLWAAENAVALVRRCGTKDAVLRLDIIKGNSKGRQYCVGSFASGRHWHNKQIKASSKAYTASSGPAKQQALGPHTCSACTASSGPAEQQALGPHACQNMKICTAACSVSQRHTSTQSHWSSRSTSFLAVQHFFLQASECKASREFKASSTMCTIDTPRPTTCQTFEVQCAGRTHTCPA